MCGELKLNKLGSLITDLPLTPPFLHFESIIIHGCNLDYTELVFSTLGATGL